MKRSFTVVVVGLIVLGLFSATEMFAAQKVIQLEFIVSTSPTPGQYTNYQEWAKEVEKKTNGEVHITIHPVGTLVAPVQGYDAVVKGIADIFYGPLGYTPGRFPMMEMFELPLPLPEGVFAGSKVVNAFYSKYKPKEFDNVKVFYFNKNVPYFISTKKPVKTMEDLKGMKIKVLGKAQVDIIAALGAVPISMANTESYDAISKGLLDGILGEFIPLDNFKLKELLKYSVMFPGCEPATITVMTFNTAKWNSLPPNIQKIIEQTIPGLLKSHHDVIDNQMVRDAKNAVLKTGHQITVLPAAEDNRWCERLNPIVDKYVKEKTAKGLPAQEALDFVLDYLKKNR